MTAENYYLGGVVQNEMRIETTDERKRLWQHLKEASGNSTKSGALDDAARYYTRMAGGTSAVPHGAVASLLQRAENQGSVTAEEIAEELSTPELPVEARTEWSVGED